MAKKMKARARRSKAIFLKGWIEDQVQVGRQPRHGYPDDGGLPELPPGTLVTPQSSYIVAQEKEREARNAQRN